MQKQSGEDFDFGRSSRIEDTVGIQAGGHGRISRSNRDSGVEEKSAKRGEARIFVDRTPPQDEESEGERKKTAERHRRFPREPREPKSGFGRELGLRRRHRNPSNAEQNPPDPVRPPDPVENGRQQIDGRIRAEEPKPLRKTDEGTPRRQPRKERDAREENGEGNGRPNEPDRSSEEAGPRTARKRGRGHVSSDQEEGRHVDGVPRQVPSRRSEPGELDGKEVEKMPGHDAEHQQEFGQIESRFLGLRPGTDDPGALADPAKSHPTSADRRTKYANTPQSACSRPRTPMRSGHTA